MAVHGPLFQRGVSTSEVPAEMVWGPSDGMWLAPSFRLLAPLRCRAPGSTSRSSYQLFTAKVAGFLG